ncbi:MAG: major histocompatibility complex class II alpha chain [Gammaproteobacteria bacterium]
MEITACSETDKEYMWGLDEEEMFYADFDQKKGVKMFPPFADPMEFPTQYQFAEANMPICKQNLDVLTQDFKDQPVSKSE